MAEEIADNCEQTANVIGLPVSGSADSQSLAQERQYLAQLANQNIFRRWYGYFTLTGPGWLQSALTLGSGSAIVSIYAGATQQYSLLWVQPLAMLLGLIMLDAIAHQTLATGQRPFGVIKMFLHPSIAWLWAFGALAVTVIWHFPQYALAAGMTEDIVKAATGWQPTPGGQMFFLLAVGLGILIVSTAITWSYGRGHKGIRCYERILKCMVWMIVVAFAGCVIRLASDGAQVDRGSQQSLGVGMARAPRTQQLPARTDLHNAPQIHHGHVGSQIADRADVMGDEQVRPSLGPLIAEQSLDNLGRTLPKVSAETRVIGKKFELL